MNNKILHFTVQASAPNSCACALQEPWWNIVVLWRKFVCAPIDNHLVTLNQHFHNKLGPYMEAILYPYVRRSTRLIKGSWLMRNVSNPPNQWNAIWQMHNSTLEMVEILTNSKPPIKFAQYNRVGYYDKMPPVRGYRQSKPLIHINGNGFYAEDVLLRLKAPRGVL